MLLDTSGLLVFFDRRNAQHARATELFTTAASRLTHSYVLAEFIALCEARRLNRLAALRFHEDLVASPEVLTVWVDRTIHRAAVRLLEHRPDKGYSLCDAVSFVLMKERGIAQALTTDRHFEQEGFVRLLEP